MGRAFRGDRVEFLSAVAGGDRCVAEFFEQRQRGIDDPWAGAVRAAQLILDLLDYFIAMSRRIGHEAQDDETQVAVVEDAAVMPPASSAAVMPPAQTGDTEPVAGKASAVMIFPIDSKHLYYSPE